MKTNKILAIGLLSVATVLATGCSDSFLEVDNPTGEPLEDYYTTDAHIQEALIAAYDPIHWADWGLDQYNALNIDAEIMGDNFWVGGSTKTDMQNWHMLFNYEGNENYTLSSLWTVDYSGVRHQPRYALMREVAAAPIGADGFFRGVCPILEPGERITNAKGYVRRCILRHGPISIVFAMYFSGGTAVRGSPDFLMRNY